MCGGGDKKARRRAKKEARRAQKEAERRVREAQAQAQRQAEQMLAQQQASYKAMQAMIPKAPETPKPRAASTTVEKAPAPGPGYENPEAGKKGFGTGLDGGIKLRKKTKKQKRGRSSLLIGLNTGGMGAGSGPNIG